MLKQIIRFVGMWSFIAGLLPEQLNLAVSVAVSTAGALSLAGFL